MNSFYEHHKDSIHWHYRCFDRILLNGLIQAVPAAGAGRRLLQYVSPAIPGDAVHPARHRRPISALGEGAGREAQHPDRRGAEGPSSRIVERDKIHASDTMARVQFAESRGGR